MKNTEEETHSQHSIQLKKDPRASPLKSPSKSHFLSLAILSFSLKWLAKMGKKEEKRGQGLQMKHEWHLLEEEKSNMISSHMVF